MSIVKKRYGIFLSVEEAAKHNLSSRYVTAQDGNIYHIKQTDLMTVCKKANRVPELPRLNEGVHFNLPKKIPFSLLSEFLIIARFYSKQHKVEVHANIYWTGQEYILTFPEQKVSREWVTFNPHPELEMSYLKVMEIHSHHVMDAFFSSQDNRDEFTQCFYAVVGRIHDFFPDIEVRAVVGGDPISVEAHQIFESPLTEQSTGIEPLPQISIAKDEFDDSTL